MKLRSELNAALYRQKMDEIKLSTDSVQYDAIYSGDIEAVKAQLENGELRLFSEKRLLSKNRLRNTVYHFVLAASAIAAACTDAGMGQTEALTLSDLYIQKADACRTAENVDKLYANMCLDFAERMQEIRKEAVISLHIRRCIDYIYENLGADLSMKALAAVAGLTPAYLSKLFREEVGIALKQFVKEARIDTAQNLLRYSDLPYLTISTSLGFSTQSVFIAAFKDIAGVTPKVYRERYYFVHK